MRLNLRFPIWRCVNFLHPWFDYTAFDFANIVVVSIQHYFSIITKFCSIDLCETNQLKFIAISSDNFRPEAIAMCMSKY